MMTKNKKLFAILILSFLILPITTVLASVSKVKINQTTIPAFDAGYSGQTSNFNWDPAAYSQWTFLNVYTTHCLEGLVNIPDGWEGDLNDSFPILATDWEVEYWPEEFNTYSGGSFKNQGGIKAINFTLRENVTFHDGSNWNATVAKWNIDRLMILSANLTGTVTSDYITRVGHMWKQIWTSADGYYMEEFYTPSWNLTHFHNWEPEYNGISNPNSTHAENRFPVINKTVIIDDAETGGKLRIEYNDWNQDPFQTLRLLYFISMETYASYNDTVIRGYGHIAPYDSSFPHLIGTGPYKYVNYDETGDPPGGTMIRNDNWWNATAMQSRGKHVLEQINVVKFPDGEAGLSSRNTALNTGQLDFASDTPTSPLVYADVISNPSVTFYNRGYYDFIHMPSMSDINNTYWKGYFDAGVLTAAYGVDKLGFVPRLTRKAISYAFDYDTYISKFDGRAQKAAIVPSSDPFYNSTWTLPYRNLTIARQTLIDSGLYDMKGLTNTSSDSEWINIAQTDPIAEFDLMWGSAREDFKDVFVTSMRDIGINIKYLDDAEIDYREVDSSTEEINDQNYRAVVGSDIMTQGKTFPEGDTWPGMKWWYYDYGFPEVGWNFAFTYNVTTNYIFDVAPFSNKSFQQKLMNQLADFCLEYQYPYLYLVEEEWGDAFYGGFYTDGFPSAIPWEFWHVQYDPNWQPAGEIPGFPVLIISTLTIFAMMSIIYSIRKKKQIL